MPTLFTIEAEDYDPICFFLGLFAHAELSACKSIG